MRRSEVVRIELARVHTAGTSPWLEVEGKGRKWRTIPLAYETAEWLDRYLELRSDDPCRRLFASLRDNGEGEMRPDAISAMLDRRTKALGMAPITAHTFRRASASNNRRNGMPDVDNMRIHGWSKNAGIQQLERYTSPEADAIAAAAFHAVDPTRPTPGRRARPLRAVR